MKKDDPKKSLVVNNQHPKKQRTFTKKFMTPGETSYKQALNN